MIIKCVDCGNQFEFSEQEIAFYKEHAFAPPKRCKLCRDIRKKRSQYDSETAKVGYKVSSFFENAKINESLIDVNNKDGSSQKSVYVICAEKDNQTRYINWDERSSSYSFVNSISQASEYRATETFEEFYRNVQRVFPNMRISLKEHMYFEPNEKIDLSSLDDNYH